MPSGLSVALLQPARRAHHEAPRQRQPHVVDAEVGEELRPRVERVGVPAPLPEDADLREPLGDEVVVVHPAGAPDAAVGHERLPLDPEARRLARRDRPSPSAPRSPCGRPRCRPRAGSAGWGSRSSSRLGLADAARTLFTWIQPNERSSRSAVARGAAALAARAWSRGCCGTRSSRGGTGSWRAAGRSCCATRGRGTRDRPASRGRAARRSCSSRCAARPRAGAAAPARPAGHGRQRRGARRGGRRACERRDAAQARAGDAPVRIGTQPGRRRASHADTLDASHRPRPSRPGILLSRGLHELHRADEAGGDRGEPPGPALRDRVVRQRAHAVAERRRDLDLEDVAALRERALRVVEVPAPPARAEVPARSGAPPETPWTVPRPRSVRDSSVQSNSAR